METIHSSVNVEKHLQLQQSDHHRYSQKYDHHKSLENDDIVSNPEKTNRGHLRSRHSTTRNNHRVSDGNIFDEKFHSNDTAPLLSGIDQPSSIVQCLETIIYLPFVLIFQCTKSSRNLIKILSLTEEGTLIGRSVVGQSEHPNPNNGLFIDRILSRKHARLYLRNNRVYIQDVGSSNGTFISGNRLSPEGKESDLIEITSRQYIDFGQDVMTGLSIPKLTLYLHFSTNPSIQLLPNNSQYINDVYNSALEAELLSIESMLDKVISRKKIVIESQNSNIVKEQKLDQEPLLIPTSIPLETEKVTDIKLPDNLHVKRFRTIEAKYYDAASSTPTNTNTEQYNIFWIMSLLLILISLVAWWIIQIPNQ